MGLPAQVNEVFLDHTSLGAPLLVCGALPGWGQEAALAELPGGMLQIVLLQCLRRSSPACAVSLVSFHALGGAEQLHAPLTSQRANHAVKKLWCKRWWHACGKSFCLGT